MVLFFILLHCNQCGLLVLFVPYGIFDPVWPDDSVHSVPPVLCSPLLSGHTSLTPLPDTLWLPMAVSL